MSYMKKETEKKYNKCIHKFETILIEVSPIRGHKVYKKLYWYDNNLNQ